MGPSNSGDSSASVRDDHTPRSWLIARGKKKRDAGSASRFVSERGAWALEPELPVRGLAAALAAAPLLFLQHQVDCR